MERADFPGLGTGYLLRGDETGGRFALLEHTIPPRRLAAQQVAGAQPWEVRPLHVRLHFVEHTAH